MKADELQNVVAIGKGAFGEVFRADYRGTTVAVKSVKEVSIENLTRFKEEIFLMHDLKHENIVLLIGACWEPDLMALVMEYCINGTASDVLVSDAGKEFSWSDPLLNWVIDVGRAMKYLHGVNFYDVNTKSQVSGIIHRDLKPDNCLVSEHYSLKVGDFGESKAYDENNTMTQVRAHRVLAARIVARNDPLRATGSERDPGRLAPVLGRPAPGAFCSPHPPLFTQVFTGRNAYLHSAGDRQRRPV